MKIIFTGGAALRRVYTDDTVGKIARLAGDEPEFCDEIRPDTEAVFTTWGMRSYDADHIQRNFPALKYIFYGAGTVQSFARPFLQRGVRIFSAWQANGVPVAEFTVSQIVLCGKRYFDVFTGAKCTPRGNYGLKVGIIGLGTIGRLVCRMLTEYKLDVYAYDKFLPDEEFARLGVKRAGLEQIFSECDVISNHLANNAQTRGMLDRRLLSMMKPDAYFINTGRGAQVDHQALYDALCDSPCRTALLDVTDPEPLPEDHPLKKCGNAIISPHIAGSLGDEVGRMGEYMCEEFGRVVSGDQPLFEVTEAMLEVMA
ncbi:MAG: hydroxyacid dehydrogenase [Clostridia bacterium]|nr:hydroxyacid dehydrogenase [Clostridia bacterium]